MLRIYFVNILFFAALINCISQNYEISISLKTKNDTVHLAHIFAKEEILRRDTTIVLIDGRGVFAGNRVLPKGLYWIVNDNRKIFQMLIGDNQKFGIEIDTTDVINASRFINSPDNDVFYAFMRDDIQRQRNQNQLIAQFQNATEDSERAFIYEQFRALSSGRMDFIKRLINENEELYASKFIKGHLPLEMPELPRDEQGNIADSDYLYRWLRVNFFSNFNIFDEDMLRTPQYEKQLMDYLTWFTQNHPPDTVCAEIDRMLNKTLYSRELFRCMLATMFNFYRQNEQFAARDNYWVHLVDNWYVPHADWATNIDDMKTEADRVRHTLVGKLAPPLDELLVLPPEHFRVAELDTAIKNDIHAGFIMSDFRTSINSKFLILLFWDVTCGSCREEILKIWDIYEATKDKGLQVLTVQTNRNIKPIWVDFINQHGMFGDGWYNAWIIYDNKWTWLYNTGFVPIMYVLNQEKEIMFKGDLDLEWLQSFIEAAN